MAAQLEVTNDAGTEATILLDGEVAIPGGPPEAQVVLGRDGRPGKLVLRDFHGEEVFRLESPLGAHMFIGAREGLAGFLHIISGFGKEAITIDGANGDIRCFDRNGTETIAIDGTRGDIRLSGADCAEMFEVAGASAAVEPGTVLVIADEGALRACNQPYDRRVAGVVSGAGGHHPGVLLNGHSREGVPVALSGRVFCKVDAASAPIEVGDLLTTASTPGHAMKASDATRAAGTVLGKAMGRLQSGQGLIPVLVALH